MPDAKEFPQITSDYRPFYKQWQETEGIDVLETNFIEDLRKVELKPWRRKGGYGAFINYSGPGDNDAYLCEIPPGGSLHPQKHMFEETLFVLEGKGSTTVWIDGGTKQTFEWGPGSLFSPPLNIWHQHVNAQRDKPARYLAVTLAPLIMNVYHNKDFVFDCPFQFSDRYHGQEGYFRGKGRLCRSANLTMLVWDSNFIPNVLELDLIEWKERGEGKSLYFELADNSLSAHMAEFPVGTYKKAHSHGHGAHIVVLTGRGYTLFWDEGQRIRRVDWKAGSLVIPPEEVVHQHFNTGDTPAKYIALHSRSSQKHRSGRKKWRDDLPVAIGGTQIEYEDEDPMVRETFEKELQKIGIECRMPKLAKK